ncbi:MAG: hypothetical protein J6039_02780, partial [Alphaproteobacteria bacterium]|nr:hypothetical protein [Alphaproteobacteria bacterium]
MVDILKEKVVKADGDCQMVVREMSDDSTQEIMMSLLKDIITTKIIQSDGSYVILNSDNLKIEEHTADGFVRKFNPESGKIKEE